MITIPGNVRVWLATGHTDLRRGFPSLARLVQESLQRNPHAGDLYVFRGRRGDLIKIIWHDGQGACLFTKRLERGRFLWPSLADGVITISVAQLSYLLSGIDWRMPQETWRQLPNRAIILNLTSLSFSVSRLYFLTSRLTRELGSPRHRSLVIGLH
jgi:transposase